MRNERDHIQTPEDSVSYLQRVKEDRSVVGNEESQDGITFRGEQYSFSPNLPDLLNEVLRRADLAAKSRYFDIGGKKVKITFGDATATIDEDAHNHNKFLTEVSNLGFSEFVRQAYKIFDDKYRTEVERNKGRVDMGPRISEPDFLKPIPLIGGPNPPGYIPGD